MKNAKQKGAQRERTVKKILEKEGYFCVKAGGSLGIFDIVALPSLKLCKEGKIPVGVQVKSTSISKAEKKRIADCSVAVQKQIWIKKNYKNWIVYVYDDINCEWKKIV